MALPPKLSTAKKSKTVTVKNKAGKEFSVTKEYFERNKKNLTSA